MARVFLMSPPPAGWRIVGAANYRSAARGETSPRRAAAEWLTLAEAIEAAGGAVCVVPPPAPPLLLTGLMYTANAGWLVTPERFRLARLSVPHRQGEGAYWRTALTALGWNLEEGMTTWEGQADMCWLGEEACLLSYGVRSVEQSAGEVAPLLPARVAVHASRLRPPFFHGDTCMNPIATPGGPVWLAYPGAFADRAIYRAARNFVERFAAVVEMGEADALAYAANSLSLGRRLLAPTGLSAELLTRLANLGLEIVPLDFSELFGKGGGGPRCLVNELRGLSAAPASAAFAVLRPALVEAFSTYPG